MFGRKRHINDAGHIKKNTRGTSNEISFSVLDAMKNSVEDDAADDEMPLGRISLFTLGNKKDSPATPTKGAQITMPGAGRGATKSGSAFSSGVLSAEASMRKKQRKRSKRALIIIVVLIAICVIAIVGTFAVHGIQSQMSQADRMRVAIEGASGYLDQLSDFKALLDAAEHDPIEQLASSDFTEKATEAIDETAGHLAKLRTVKTQIEDLKEGLFSPAESENANQTLSNINEYTNLLERGSATLKQVSQVVSAYQEAVEYQTLILEADTLVREAIEISNTANDDAFRQALEKSREAFEKLAVARDTAEALIAQTKELFATAPINGMDSSQLIQPFVDYANLRIQAQDFAIAADEAFLAKNSAKLIEANDGYNALETQAAELIAQQNGLFPADLIKQAFAQTR